MVIFYLLDKIVLEKISKTQIKSSLISYFILFKSDSNGGLPWSDSNLGLFHACWHPRAGPAFQNTPSWRSHQTVSRTPRTNFNFTNEKDFLLKILKKLLYWWLEMHRIIFLCDIRYFYYLKILAGRLSGCQRYRYLSGRLLDEISTKTPVFSTCQIHI